MYLNENYSLVNGKDARDLGCNFAFQVNKVIKGRKIRKKFAKLSEIVLFFRFAFGRF